MSIEDQYYYGKLAQLGVEEFVDIPGYEGFYQASNLGRIKSVRRVIKRSDGKTQTFSTRILKTRPANGGYHFVRLAKVGLHRNERVHRLVAITFLGELPVGYQTCHGNGDCTDNRLDNLRYRTMAENYIQRSVHYFRNKLLLTDV